MREDSRGPMAPHERFDVLDQVQELEAVQAVVGSPSISTEAQPGSRRLSGRRRCAPQAFQIQPACRTAESARSPHRPGPGHARAAFGGQTASVPPQPRTSSSECATITATEFVILFFPLPARPPARRGIRVDISSSPTAGPAERRSAEIRKSCMNGYCCPLPGRKPSPRECPG